MKNHILRLLLLLAIAAGLAAAAASVRVDNLGNAYRINPDGTEVNLGAPFDAMANHLASNPGLASEIQIAATKALNDFKAIKDAEVAAKATRVATLEQHVAALNAYIAALRLQAAAAGVITVAPPAAP